MALETGGTISINPAVTASPTSIEKIAPATPDKNLQQDQTAAVNSEQEQLKSLSKDKVNIDSSPVSPTALETLKHLDVLQKKSNEIAQNIRTTNKNLNDVTELVTQMQSNLASITKNFPPFNVESKERQEILMSYISIRQQLVKMTVPPPPAPLYENVLNIWKKSFDKNGNLLPEAVPALQTDSSDSNVQSAEKSLQDTRTNLGDAAKSLEEFRGK